MKYVPTLALFLLCSAISACKAGPDPGVAGIYQTWDDVITRWIGKPKDDLYLELGPPNLHPKEAEDGTIERVCAMTIVLMLRLTLIGQQPVE